ncbi:MAG TPA: hypothetical protein PKV53_11115, partial [Anaerohalosphaeraceae bacterium]|nr:hypothetical protein [Anaerohalosphaeraceae bacterium]
MSRQSLPAGRLELPAEGAVGMQAGRKPAGSGGLLGEEWLSVWACLAPSYRMSGIQFSNSLSIIPVNLHNL